MRLSKKHSDSTYFVYSKYISFVVFFFSVNLLFVYLNKIHPYYFIDEVFHIPQVLQYCAGNFTEWNPKITTLPGLYIITSIILSPLNLCNTFSIRYTNLLATFLNLYLSYNVIKEIHKTDKTNNESNWKLLVLAYNLTLLPPLFFWFFLYYTDVVSVSMILLMILMHFRRKFIAAAFAGLLSVLVRQTNIIWVAFFGMERLLDLLDSKTPKSIMQKSTNSIIHVRILWDNIMREVHQGPMSFLKFIRKIVFDLLPYISVGLIFLTFLIWNKGIVVGDHSAHKPTLHIPQIFYFSIFVFAFSWPYLLPHLRSFVLFVRERCILTSFLFAFTTIAVHYNTLVHPYVLADNRHYVFYVWNKLMGRYVIFRYLMIPIYCFTLYTIFCGISHLRFMTQISYFCSVCLVLIPQLLLEPRYFVLPYILYRLSIQQPKKWQIVMESSTTLILIFLQFFIFVNKEFYWSDEPHPQRIAW